MEIGQYIRELLVENEYVIIPGFGALTTSYQPARYDESQGLLLPPANEIVFNEKLKTGDGILCGRIAAAEDIPAESATKIISDFCETARYRLGNNLPVEIKGVGTFRVGENQNLIFEADPGENLLIDSYGLEPAVLKTKEEKDKPAKNIKPEGKKFSFKIPPFKWQWLIPVPLVVAGILFFLLHTPSPVARQNQEQETPPDSLAQQMPAANSPDTSAADSAKTIIHADTIKTAVPAPENGKYILIGGSFKSQENADKYFNQVKKLGYQPIKLGEQGGFFIVAVGAYATAREAEEARLSYLNIEPESGAWVVVKNSFRQ